jgi:pimeloyl-ACP methyl ester carboxylesterase
VNRSSSTGRLTAGVLDVVLDPHYRAARNPVVYCHGGSADALQAAGVGLAAIPGVLAALTRALFTIAAPTLGVAHWGNPAARARIADAVAWLEANRAVAGPAILVGTSMGAAAALNYAADNPGDVAAVVGIIPAVDLQAVRVADTGGARAGRDAAYGVAYPAALPAGANPAARVAELDVPVLLCTASDDAISVNAGTFAAAIGAELVDVGALGHDNDAVAAVDPEAVAAFVNAATLLG